MLLLFAARALVNKASIHVDFVLNKPSVEADSKIILRRGRVVGQHRRSSPKAHNQGTPYS
jgi:hypothetical protein